MRATPCPHALSHACVCARHTGACNMPWVQQRRCWRRTLRESSRERRVGDGADSSSSEAGRVPEEPQAATDGGARCTARVREAGDFGTALWGVSRESNARGLVDHEHLGRGAYVPLFSPPITPILCLTPGRSRADFLFGVRDVALFGSRSARYFSPTCSPRARRSAPMTCHL